MQLRLAAATAYCWLSHSYIGQLISIESQYDDDRVMTTGAAATTVASLLKYSEKFKGKRVVLVLCGRNVAFEIVRQVCNSSIPK